jgi:hypothetical protein
MKPKAALHQFLKGTLIGYMLGVLLTDWQRFVILVIVAFISWFLTHKREHRNG